MKDLVDELRMYLAKGFEQQCLDATVKILDNKDNPLYLNLFAVSMRELVRNVLARLSPDDEVKSCSWYKEDAGKVKYPIRAQRIQYVIHGGLTPDYVNEELEIDTAHAISCLTQHFSDLSEYTHFSEKNFGIIDTEDAFARDILSSALNVFREMSSCRKQVESSALEYVKGDVLDKFLFETVGDLDLLATHYFVELVECIDTEVKAIQAKSVVYEVGGVVDVELQYGSNSDLKNDFGATAGASLPFTATVNGDVAKLELIQDVEEINVNTDSWYGLDE